MKKIIMIAAIAAATAGFGAFKSLDDIRADLEKCKEIAATNNASLGSYNWRWICGELQGRVWYAKDRSEECAKLASEADDFLSGLGYKYSREEYTKSVCVFPKLAKAAYDASGIEKSCPVMCAIAKKYGGFCSPICARNALTMDERLQLLSESVSLLDGKVRMESSYRVVVDYCQRIQSDKAVVKAIRKYLRSQGKSFVTKDGVNPCEGLMKELNAALNAPRFKGLNEWMEKVGFTARIDESQLPTEEFVAQLKEDVLNGERDMTENVAFVLKVNLGVEGYNAFVKEYNGEK